MIEIETTPLLRAMATTALAIEKRRTVPALTGMRARLNGSDSMILTGTNMDQWIETTVPASRNGGGQDLDQIVMNPTSFRRALERIGSESVAINRETVVSAGALSMRMDDGFHPGENHPPPPSLDEESGFTATLGEDALHALTRVRPAISTEATRYYLNGVYLRRVNDWDIRAVATDGHRMMIEDFPAPDAEGTLDLAGHEGVILPHKALSILLRMAKSNKGEPIRMRVAPKMALNSEGRMEALTHSRGAGIAEFTVGQHRLVTKLVDGTFPNYSRVIPQDTPYGATFDRADLLRLVEAINAGHNRGAGSSLSITIDGRRGLAQISSKWEFSDTLSAEIACETNLTATTIRFGVNSFYLIDALKPLAPSERVAFAFTEQTNQDDHQASDPMIITAADTDPLQILLMPMRI